VAEQAAPIQLEELRYALDGRVILDGLDLSVRRGEIVAVMGRSGTGKTTLLRLIMGLISPTGGRILVNGVDLAGLSERELDELRMGVGMVFQGAALLDSLTVFENVALGLVEHRRIGAGELAGRVAGLLEMVGMSGTESLLPEQLSGGMRKRVGVARALAMGPSIMLYDEPTAGLDPISASALHDLIRRLRDQVGVTSVVVSHDLSTLRSVSDRAALLHRGRLLALGPLAELERSADPAVVQFLSGRPDGPLADEAALA